MDHLRGGDDYVASSLPFSLVSGGKCPAKTAPGPVVHTSPPCPEASINPESVNPNFLPAMDSALAPNAPLPSSSALGLGPAGWPGTLYNCSWLSTVAHTSPPTQWSLLE